MSTNFEAAANFFSSPALYIPDPVPLSSSAMQPVKGLTPGSSPWWIDRLTTAMAQRADRLLRLRAYYEGTQDTWRLSSTAFRTTFGRAFLGMKANLPKMIVDSAVHRMQVTGFRVAGATTDPATETDPEAWRIWQANNLDSLSVAAIAQALALGECPMMVAPNPNDPKTPRITLEDPLQVIVDRDPADPQTRRAALKGFTDDNGLLVHILYLPDRIEWWLARNTPSGGDGWGWVAPYTPNGLAFQLRGVHYELDRTRSTAPAVAGEIPVVPLVNSPGIDGCGQSDFAAVLPLVDAYNKTLMDILVTAEFHAAPQRWAVGVALDEEATQKDADGNVVAESASQLKAAPDRIWSTENPDAKFGEFPATDLAAFQAMFGELTTKIGAISFTPYHMLMPMPTSVPPTGESLKSAETPLVARVRRHMLDIGEGLEEVMRLAFLTAGETTRAGAQSETRWANPESRLMSVLADAIVKLKAVGVPDPALWAEWGFTPEQIAQFKEMLAAEPPAPAAAPGAIAPDQNGTNEPNGLTNATGGLQS